MDIFGAWESEAFISRLADCPAGDAKHPAGSGGLLGGLRRYAWVKEYAPNLRLLTIVGTWALSRRGGGRLQQISEA